MVTGIEVLDLVRRCASPPAALFEHRDRSSPQDIPRRPGAGARARRLIRATGRGTLRVVTGVRPKRSKRRLLGALILSLAAVGLAPAAASAAWTAPVTLSAAGQPAVKSAVGVDPAGNTTFIWLRSDGINFRAQVRRRSAAGALTPVHTLPGVALDDGFGEASRPRSRSIPTGMQSSSGPTSTAPTPGSGPARSRPVACSAQPATCRSPARTLPTAGCGRPRRRRRLRLGAFRQRRQPDAEPRDDRSRSAWPGPESVASRSRRRVPRGRGRLRRRLHDLLERRSGHADTPVHDPGPGAQWRRGLSAVQTISLPLTDLGCPDVGVDSGGDAIFTWSRLQDGDFRAREPLAIGSRRPGPARPSRARATTALPPGRRRCRRRRGVRLDSRRGWVRGVGPGSGPVGCGVLSPIQTIRTGGVIGSQVAVDSDGDAVFTWRRNDGSNSLAEARTRSATTGALGPLAPLSAPGASASAPRLAVNHRRGCRELGSFRRHQHAGRGGVRALVRGRAARCRRAGRGFTT